MTTEELKREMYFWIAELRSHFTICNFIPVQFTRLEDSLEEYLDALHQDAGVEDVQLEHTMRMNQILSDAYERQQSLTHAACKEEREEWVDIKQLEADLKTSRDREAFLESLCSGFEEQLGIASGQRDQYRNKLQAFEFANKSAGELLIRAQETIKRQRKFIRTLYTSRKARKVVGATRIQSSGENVPCVKCGGTASIMEMPFWGISYPCLECQSK